MKYVRISCDHMENHKAVSVMCTIEDPKVYGRNSKVYFSIEGDSTNQIVLHPADVIKIAKVLMDIGEGD